MLPVKQTLPADQKKLLAAYVSLPQVKQQQLLEFAEFLTRKSVSAEAEAEATLSPAVLDIPRPENETVVAAMRRLTTTYTMVDTDGLLDQASLLMSAHVLQGKSAEQVIDELELLFEKAYSRMSDHATDN